jgi:beta-glucanase (GH16 family)
MPEKPVTPPAPKLFADTPSWTQDFSAAPNGELDDQFWNIETGNNDGWGNQERQYYSARQRNVRIEDHALVINARRESYKGQRYTSARLQTAGKFDFTYGKLRVQAKLPEGAGIWPAIWLWPTDDKYGNQPLAASEKDYSWLANGEIDITEGQAQGDNQYSGSAHAISNYPGNGERTGYVNVADASTAYHTYGLDWTPDKLVYSVDEQPFYEVTNPHTGFKAWPYDQRYHLILNIAMGGAMSSNLRSQYPPDGITKAVSEWTMAIKSITYYPLAQ